MVVLQGNLVLAALPSIKLCAGLAVLILIGLLAEGLVFNNLEGLTVLRWETPRG
ncbi:hypothetical protein D3C76_798190 [compost metagenome]|jgi:hypothetical protein|uniref:ABC transporter permease n=1 Tax=Pseudomonas putida S12 TaxID=1215087 RepID=A0AA34RTL9_PSEPU|nr:MULTISPECIES: hypothetical protein [Pseudomonas]AJA13371.1 ABC transporter permease [Pseudomonas putida S12]TFF50230.1 ABC transporter permease [Pseudomonas putida]USX38268.1 ABC transporter permease [Pseudomonas putida]HBK49355.1 ABC transporter permease [Pseudomonas sp.]